MLAEVDRIVASEATPEETLDALARSYVDSIVERPAASPSWRCTSAAR